MALESGSKIRISLTELLLNLCEVTGVGTPIVCCPSACKAATELYYLVERPNVEAQTIDDDDDPTWTFEDWRPWREQIRKLCYAQDNAYRLAFAWLADVLTANDEDSCRAALQRAEMALVSAVVKGVEHMGGDTGNLSSWAFGNAVHRERRMVLRDAVLARREHDAAVADPPGKSFKHALPRPRRNQPSNPNPPKPPPPPPPPPDPVLPDDLQAAERTRLVEVLTHPTNLSLLGLKPDDVRPSLPLNRLRALVGILRGAA